MCLALATWQAHLVANGRIFPLDAAAEMTHIHQCTLALGATGGAAWVVS